MRIHLILILIVSFLLITQGCGQVIKTKKNTEENVYQVENNLAKVAEQYLEIEQAKKDRSPKSVNIDLIYELVDKGLIDTELGFMFPKRDGDHNYDIPSVIALINDNDHPIKKMTRPEILEAFSNTKLLSPQVKKVLTCDQAIWDEIPEQYKWELIYLASQKDHLEKKATKQVIVDNLVFRELVDLTENDLAEKYIDNDISLESFLEQQKAFIRLDPIPSFRSYEQLFEHVIGFYEEVFLELDIQVEIKRDSNFVQITDNGIQHFSYDLVDSFEEYLDPTTNLSTPGTYFYEGLLRPVLQIGSDHEFLYGCGVYKLTINQVLDHYQEFIKIALRYFPELEVYNASYVVILKKKFADLNVGTSFPSCFVCNQVVIGDDFSSSNYSAFISSKKKNDFIEFLVRNKSSLNLDEESLIYKKTQIQRNMFKSTIELLEYISGSRIKSTSYSKENYEYRLPNEDHTFPEAFPSIYELIGNDFAASNFSYDKEKDMISFNYKEKQYSIKAGKKHMLEFIAKESKASVSGKVLYPSFQLEFSDFFYYLTPEQRDFVTKFILSN